MLPIKTKPQAPEKLDLQLIQAQTNNARAELEKVQKDIQLQLVDMAEAKTMTANHLQAESDAKERLSKVLEELVGSQKNLVSLKSYIKNAKEEADTIRRNAELEAQAVKSKALVDKQALEVRKEGVKAEIEQIVVEKGVRGSELEAVRKELAQANRLLVSRKANVLELDHQIKDRIEDLAGLSEDFDGLNGEIGNLAQKSDEAKNRLSALNLQISDSKKELEILNASAEDKRIELKAIESQLENKKDAILFLVEKERKIEEAGERMKAVYSKVGKTINF